jgi:hypothetical protein
MPKYELQAGRLILRDGKRFCNLMGCIVPATGERLYDPAELDSFCRDIVAAMNLKPRHRASYYTIAADDVGKSTINPFGRVHRVTDFIGRIMPQDVGKRVYERDNVLQVENDEQLARRLAKSAK